MGSLVLALLVAGSSGTPITIPEKPAYPTIQIVTPGDAPLHLPGTPEAGLQQDNKTEKVIQVAKGDLFLVPEDGDYLNAAAAIHAANDRLAVQQSSLPGIVIPAAISAVLTALVTGYVASRAARKLPLF